MSDQFWVKEKRMEVPTAVIEIGGRLGANPAKELRQLCATLRGKGYAHLIIDMSEITFIASSGIGALIVLTGEFSIKGGSATFVSISQPVQRTVKMLNLGQFLTVAANEQEAMANLGAKS